MLKNESLMKQYDLSSVRQIITGAAPLGLETAEDLHRIQPTWQILQAYGMTETTAVATHTSPHDIFFGSAGCLLPLLQARIVDPDGNDINEYDKPGELLLSGPTIVLGYLDNEEANKETFQNGWLRTGDEAVVRESPKGEDHIFVVDRIKELIKVKVRSRYFHSPPPFKYMVLILLCINRASKSPPPNSKRTSSHTPPSPTPP